MSVLEQIELQKPPGRPSKLSIENQLLMTLEYWREYRTYFHIGQTWGVNESTAYRIVRKIEDRLVSSRAFTLPGKKKLQQSSYKLEVVVVDVTETPVERPKKKKVLQWQKEKTYTQITSGSESKHQRNHLYGSWQGKRA